MAHFYHFYLLLIEQLVQHYLFNFPHERGVRFRQTGPVGLRSALEVSSTSETSMIAHCHAV
jgi:hypothetical protein